MSKDDDLEALVFELKSVLNPEGTPGRFQFFTNGKYLQSFSNAVSNIQKCLSQNEKLISSGEEALKVLKLYSEILERT